MRTVDPILRRHILALALVLVVLGLAGDWVNPWLRYDRDAIAAGQVWRLISCHLVHLNAWHMAMNLSGFVLCWFFFTDLLTRRVLWLWFGASSVLVGLAFWLLDPQLERYVGLSGVLHGFLVMCLVAGLRGNPVLHTIVLGIVAARLVWEQLPGYDIDYLRAWIAGSVYVNAHLYGSLVGAVLGVGLLAISGRKPSSA